MQEMQKMQKQFSGCWPTMITPFTEDNRIDFQAVRGLVDWFIARGCDGIFAVCQSSEMFFLNEQEKIDLAEAVRDAAGGRVKVIASGHTAEDRAQQVEELGRMAELGLDGVVVVSNRFARQDEGEEDFRRGFEEVTRQLPGVTFGLYECPYPYLRLLSTEFLADCAEKKRLVFLKDVSCARAIQKERVQAVAGKDLALFNANTATLLDSLIDGYDGYNGVMANFHIDLYKWMYTHFREQPDMAREVSDFLTLAGVSEVRAYPVNAKYHQNRVDVPMTLVTRSRDPACLNENARLEVEALIRLEEAWRKRLRL